MRYCKGCEELSASSEGMVLRCRKTGKRCFADDLPLTAFEGCPYNEAKNKTEIPFAQFFEDSIKTITEDEAKNVLICARMRNGDIYTGYDHVSTHDKAAIASAIFADAMMEIIRQNIGMIKDALDEYEEKGKSEDG